MVDERLAILAMRNRLLAVSGLPTGKAWINTAFDPTAGQSYLTEAFEILSGDTLTFPANGGQVEETGNYIITWVGIAGVGLSAITAGVKAIKARFAPGTPLGVLADGSALRVRSSPGPTSGRITPMDGGWAFCIVRIPWLARSVNAVV